MVGVISTRVDWIDKTPPTAELKYVKESGKVTVSVINPSEQITFKEGNGVYVFTEIGSYEIVFYDKAGNEGRLVAVVDSLKADSSGNGGNSNDHPSNSNGYHGAIVNGSNIFGRPNDPANSDDSKDGDTSDKTSDENEDKTDVDKPINSEYKKLAANSGTSILENPYIIGIVAGCVVIMLGMAAYIFRKNRME